MTNFVKNTLNKKNGMLILCGKGQLPLDAQKEGFLDAVVTPPTVIDGKSIGIEFFNILEGQEPEEFSKILYDIFGADGDQFFSNAARDLLYQSFVCLKELSLRKPEKYKLTFTRLHKMIHELSRTPVINTEAGETEALPCEAILDILECSPEAEMPGSTIDKMLAFYKKHVDVADVTKSGIVQSVDVWMAAFAQKPKLNKWLDSDKSSINISEILRGLKVGVALNSNDYQQAGEAIQKLVKARIYKEISSRKDRKNDPDFYETGKRARVFVIVDESQDLVTAADVEILPKARSLDMVAVFATQNLENYISKLGKDETNAFMRSFASKVMLRTSAETYNLIINDMGSAYPRVSGNVATDRVDRMATNMKQMSALIYNPENEYHKDVRTFGKQFTREVKSDLNNFSDLFKKGDRQKKIAENQSQQGGKVKAKGDLAKAYEAPINFEEREKDAKPEPIFGEQEFQWLNQNPYHAVAYLNRGNAPRFDIIKLDADLKKSRMDKDVVIEEVLTESFHYETDIDEIQKEKLMKGFFGEDEEEIITEGEDE